MASVSSLELPSSERKQSIGSDLYENASADLEL